MKRLGLVLGLGIDGMLLTIIYLASLAMISSVVVSIVFTSNLYVSDIYVLIISLSVLVMSIEIVFLLFKYRATQKQLDELVELFAKITGVLEQYFNVMVDAGEGLEKALTVLKKDEEREAKVYEQY